MRESLVPERSGASEVTTTPPLPESIQRVLESRTFERSPTLRTLLAYLWKNREEPIGEYAIATEALGRSTSFDAKIDATVRVQISRLRQRLEKFYEQEGKDLPERIVIPLGAHQIKLEPIVAVAPSLPVVALPPLAPPLPDHSGVIAINRRLAWTCIILLAFAAGLGIELYHVVRTSRPPGPEQAPRFWRAFFGERRQTRIILPTPVFYSYLREPSTVMVRDTSINEFADRGESQIIGSLEKALRLGNPSLAQNYTVTSDTFASVSLVRYLDRFAFNTRVRSSAEAPLEALDSENVIAVGTWGTLTPLKPYLDRMTLQLGTHEQYVQVRSPQAGEPDRVSEVEESPERSVWPGVVAVLPGPSGKTRLLLLASRHTSALVSALTSAHGLDQIDRLWKSKGSPDFFEMILNSEMNGSELVRSRPVFMRPIRAGNSVTPGN